MDAKLQDHSQAADQTSRPDIFISRAGADQIIATNIAQLLEQAGHKVIIQDWDFQNRNFAERMNAALASGARVIALLSPDYLASDACKAEYLSVLAADPLNNTGRLIVMRVSECEPIGLLRGIAYWDLVPLREMSEAAQEQISRDIVLTAVNPAQRTAMPLDQYWRPARAILHRNIRNTPNFTGRDAALLDLDEALWSVHSAQPLTNGHDTTIAAAAITQATIAHGLGGIGKTTLARQYGYDAQSGYAGVWWLHAERGAGGAKDDANNNLSNADAVSPNHSPPPPRGGAGGGGSHNEALHLGSRPLIHPTPSPPRQGEGEERAIPLAQQSASVDAASGWSGVIEGLVELGALFIRGLDQAQDRAAAARRTLDFLAHAGFEKPWLLIFDNVDDTSILRHWGPPADAGGAIQVLMTTRVAGWSAAVKRVEVEELPLQDAAMFLVRDSGRPDLGAEGAIELAKALGRLPLALSHASAYLRRRQTVTPAAYLQALQRHMSDAPKGAEYDRSVFATFLAAAEQAEEDADGAAAILALAAFFGPDDVPVELFEQDPELYPDVISIVLTLPGQLDEALGALAHFSLIDYDAATRTFSLHRLVQAATRDALAEDETRALSASAVKVMAHAFPAPKFETWPKCARLIDHAEHLFKLVNDDVAPEELAALLHNAGDYLKEQAAFDDAEPLYLRALVLKEKRLGPDHPDVGLNLNNLAELYRAQGGFNETEPLYRRALIIFETTLGSDHPYVGGALMNLASLLLDTGRLSEALPLSQRAVTIMLAAVGPDHPNTKTAQNVLAEIEAALAANTNP